MHTDTHPCMDMHTHLIHIHTRMQTLTLPHSNTRTHTSLLTRETDKSVESSLRWETQPCVFVTASLVTIDKS